MLNLNNLNNGGSALVLAVGAVVLAPVVLPVLGQVGRPLVKTVIKGGALAVGVGREGVVQTRRYFEEAYAEAQAELGQAPRAALREVPRPKEPAEASRAEAPRRKERPTSGRPTGGQQRVEAEKPEVEKLEIEKPA
jgi:hypothetical protein